jgi:DNA-binding GntR family transcriptional regulator
MAGNRKNLSQPNEASRVDEVYERIILEIVRGELPGGTKLKSTELARRLGLSRTPVVQALQRLAADGLVLLEMNKRAVVRPGAETWLVEIHQLRELLEPAATAAAATNISQQTLDELRALAQSAKPGDSPDWAEKAEKFDFALHLAIADCCGNFVLGESIRKCWTFKRVSYTAVPQEPSTLEKGYTEHLVVLDALAARDPETARAAMQYHLRSAAHLKPTATIV